jgi:ankyrin repeat protein
MSASRAMTRGKCEVIEELMKGGANIDEQDNDGNTALMHASILGEVDTVNKLLRYFPNPDIKNNEGDTPLIRVAKDGKYVSVAKRLVMETADILIKNNEGKNVLEVAKIQNIRAAIFKKIKERYNKDPEFVENIRNVYGF